MHGSTEKYIHSFWQKNLKGRDDFRDLVVDERIILKWNTEKYGVISLEML
jgi:hypothetical protein